jgi:PAS domain S-box-containing protein
MPRKQDRSDVLEQQVQERTAKLKEAIRKLKEKDRRYRFLYEFSPFPLAEIDVSQVKGYLASLLKRGVEDFRSYFEAHPEALKECGTRRRLVDVNNAMVELFEAESKEQLLKESETIFTSESYKGFCGGIIAYAEGNDTFECEMPGRTFAGKRKLFYLRWSIISGFEDSRTRMLACFIDITYRKELVDELTVFKTAADTANFGNVIVSPQNKFSYVNEAFASMHGYAAEELTGRHLTILHTEEQMVPIRKWGKRLQAGEKVKNVEIWHKKKDGTVFPTLMNAVTIKDAQGKSLGIYSSAIDMSDLKKAETALHEREEELEAKNIRLEEMNAALKILLQSRETDKSELEEKVVQNVKELSLPIVEKLRSSGLNAHQRAYVDVLESSLHEIISPFVRSLSSHYPGLTPTELTIANLIKEGKDSKDIAEMLNLSKRSVDTYRNRIRKKLGITNEKVNLRVHLLRLC